MTRLGTNWQILLLATVWAAGCSRGGQPSDSPAASPVPAAEGRKYLLDTEPAGAKGVLEVRKQANDGDEVLILGRVGGSRKPLVAGRAAFTIVDPSLKACNELPGDTCPYPWDYCCEPPDDLARASTLVKFVDEHGDTIPVDARQLLAIRELQTVVVQGRAKRDEAGNLTVLATKLHIRPQ